MTEHDDRLDAYRRAEFAARNGSVGPTYEPDPVWLTRYKAAADDATRRAQMWPVVVPVLLFFALAVGLGLLVAAL